MTLKEEEITFLCLKVQDIFLAQPTLLRLKAPINVCGLRFFFIFSLIYYKINQSIVFYCIIFINVGDIHGQYFDLLRFFEKGGFPPDVNYLFLGDYVDRGTQSLETICLLFAYKIKYPETFFLLRGNHECASINRIYGFYDECLIYFVIYFVSIFKHHFNSLFYFFKK